MDTYEEAGFGAADLGRYAWAIVTLWTLAVIMALVWNLLNHQRGVLEMARDHGEG